LTKSLSELYRFRELLVTIANRDIRVKYKQSMMGIMWAILMPSLVVGAGILVRYGAAVLSKTEFRMTDVLEVSVKAVPWAFMVSSIRFACSSLTQNASLVTRVYFPKEIFPLSAIISQACDFGVACALLLVLLVVGNVGVSPYLLWLPVLLITMFLLVAGIGIFVSAASLFFRDVRYIVEVLLTFAIFFTPVFYNTEMFGAKGQLLLLNPAAPILEGFRACLVQQRAPQIGWVIYSLMFSTVLLWSSYAMFKKLEPKFAESI
jgi:ABC-type polysaccharide/polyol phosphate export permease